MSNSNEVEYLAHSSREALSVSLTPVLLSRTGFTISEVRDKVNEIVHPNKIHNY